MASRCSGHKWTPAAGPGLQPGPRACACGVAPTSSLALRGPQGEWGLWQPRASLSHSRASGKKRMTGGLDRDSEPRCHAQTRLSPGGRHGRVRAPGDHGASARAARALDPPAPCHLQPGPWVTTPASPTLGPESPAGHREGGRVLAPAPHGLSCCHRDSEPCPL